MENRNVAQQSNAAMRPTFVPVDGKIMIKACLYFSPPLLSRK